jgi:hypothetical protein
MILSAISGSSNPAPREYKACTYDDTNQGILKAMYNNLVRDENTYQDNECKDCQRERYSAERSWEMYDGEF